MGRHLDSSPPQKRSVHHSRDILATAARPPHHPNELYMGTQQGPRQPRPSHLLRSPCLAGARRALRDGQRKTPRILQRDRTATCKSGAIRSAESWNPALLAEGAGLLIGAARKNMCAHAKPCPPCSEGQPRVFIRFSAPSSASSSSRAWAMASSMQLRKCSSPTRSTNPARRMVFIGCSFTWEKMRLTPFALQ